MPVTLVTTVGGASSNSYATLADATSYAETLWPRSAAWEGATMDTRNRALVTACRELDSEHFVGDRVDATQALAWPRAGVFTPYRQATYLTPEIPGAVLRAQIVRAMELVHQAEAVGGLAPDDLAGVSSFSLGGEVSVTLDGDLSNQKARDRFFASTVRPILGDLVYTPQVKMVRG
jgi:hypothetical protein